LNLVEENADDRYEGIGTKSKAILTSNRSCSLFFE